MKLDGTHKKKICPNCGKEIQAANFNKHYNCCVNGYKNKECSQNIVYNDQLKCPFCEKILKNKNAYAQHYVRCKNNDNAVARNNLSDYILKNRKDKNKYNCLEIAKQSNTMKDKYNAGYKHPLKGTTNTNYEDNIYFEENKIEIQKWFNYIKDISILDFEVNYNSSYPTVSKLQEKVGDSVKCTFAHNYIANILLQGNLKSDNTVHHIDKNINNFDKYNLMVFETRKDHKRYHNSKFAKLEYDNETHLFRCAIKK